MADYVAPVRDIRFALEHLVDLAGLAELEGWGHADPASVAGLVEEYGRFVQDVIAPLNRVGDIQGSTWSDGGVVRTPEGFAKAYAAYVESGWGGVPFPEAYGGGGFPWLVGIALQEIITSANMAFSLCPMLTQGAIDMIWHHGSEAQRELFLPRMVTGEWTGTMNLTEPQAGSDVGALTTRAVRHDDGTYRITGTKIFITWGEHDMAGNIVHLVLARTPGAPPGTKGISCFIVPKFLVGDDGSLGERNDVTCVSVEHKMGIHASPTCVLSFGDRGDGAVGYLVGEENAGMRYMFTMMNNARLTVGLEGLSIAQRALQDAVAYANVRQQGRAPGAPAGESARIVEHPDVRRMLLTMRAYVEAMRGLIYANAEAIDLARRAPDEAARLRASERADLLTPISKAWCTDLGSEVASLAIQVHGGIGYIEESGVPQHYRDARIAAIYEGTNGIQAIDLVGRKLPMRGGAVMGDLLDEIDALDAPLAAAGDSLAATRRNLAEAASALRRATEWLLRRGQASPVDVLAGATPYLRCAGLVVGGWVMARQALTVQRLLQAAAPADRPFLEQKLVSARFYGEQLLPQAPGLLPAITASNDLLAAADFPA